MIAVVCSCTLRSAYPAAHLAGKCLVAGAITIVRFISFVMLHFFSSGNSMNFCLMKNVSENRENAQKAA